MNPTTDEQRMAKAAAFAQTAEGRRLDTIMRGVAEGLAPVLSELKARISKLETTLSENPPLTYCGVWVEGAAYSKNNCVTAGGHLWIARTDTTRQPGTSPDQWTMAIRKPRDARDARPAKEATP